MIAAPAASRRIRASRRPYVAREQLGRRRTRRSRGRSPARPGPAGHHAGVAGAAQELQQVRRRSPDEHDLGRRPARRPVEGLGSRHRQGREVRPGRRVAVDDPAGQPARPELDTGGPGQALRPDLHELARAAADVDDQEVVPDGPARREPDERQERLLLVLEDGRAGRRSGPTRRRRCGSRRRDDGAARCR